MSPTLHLKGFTFAELFTPDGLLRLDNQFLQCLQEEKPHLYQDLLAYRNQTKEFSQTTLSELLIHCATYLESFLSDLFDIEEAAAANRAYTISHNPISSFKQYFVVRRAKKELMRAETFPPFSALHQWLLSALETFPIKTTDEELAIALLAKHYLENAAQFHQEINTLVQWCVQALATPEGKAYVAGWTSFKMPERLNYPNLVETISTDDCKAASPTKISLREGFTLTDKRMSTRAIQDEVNYCIYCHDHQGDFCSKGFPVKKGDAAQGFRKNPLGTLLTGCPLEEKISEMHHLRKEGLNIAALAMIMVDNPMCPATGHRICNDCMKACIYQKQTPVNIPQVETGVLVDVLDLPWGVEIYDLLTRWNPLRQHQWRMKPYNGLKVMIAGMGPAGFTLAHHLLLEGFAVVGVDGLKIEPLPQTLIQSPIHRFADLKESLDERLMAGFGGVAEYGITVRWDKNFLKLIYLSLMRRPYFQVFGGVRLGGTITVEDAWEMGFDHFAMAVGAGLPKALSIPGSLAPGMRQASDFLMMLQLGNAAKANSLTNLQIRLPAVVIGGGLTGIDTATELQAYYIAQVEKILNRYEILLAHSGKEAIYAPLDPAAKAILDEFLEHGHAVREERTRAMAEGSPPHLLRLIHQWGGVTIVYRRSMQESPAYINNHEEMQKALAEGIYYRENLEPFAIDLDQYGHAEALICHKRAENTPSLRLPARSILVATGTKPNIAYAFEHRQTFNRLKWQYQHYEDSSGEMTVTPSVMHCKDPQFGPFTSYQKNHYRVSLIGDTHPVFHGSVVKAIASGLRTYPKILNILKDKLDAAGDPAEYAQFTKRMQYLFKAHIISCKRETKNVITLTIQAPMAVKHFKAGQFYRLQNFETLAPHVENTLLQMEPLPLVAASCDRAQGLLTFLVQENTTSAKLCAILKPGEAVSLMGPTGVRAKIPSGHETVLIIGDTSSFSFVQSYGTALKTNGNRVLYCADVRDESELFCQAALEQAADKIIWHTDKDIIETLLQYQNEENKNISLTDIDRIYVIGNTELLRRFQTARSTSLKAHLVKNPKVFGSVYGHMQCMLKGVCAQCLQWQINPETGERTKAVFACSWQDQPLERIDIDHVDDRYMQNFLLEHLNKLWVDYLFSKHEIARV